MKYSLSSRQQSSYLQKCDEIRVKYEDRNIIPNLIENYPGKTINLEIYSYDRDNIKFQDLKNYHILCKGNFIIGFTDIEVLKIYIESGFKAYLLLSVNTFQQLRLLKDIGACYAYIDAPLFFSMDKVKKINIPIRIICNKATDNYFIYPNGVSSPWIRPEDIELYENYIDIISFDYERLEQERSLFRIYAEQHNWPGDLNMIIPHLNYIGTNRMIPSSIAKKRLNCGQKCEENKVCQLCYRALKLANPKLFNNEQLIQKNIN